VARDESYDQLAAYTLGRGDAGFIHQHVVDAYAVKTGTDDTKPIRTAQAIIGLYLHAEHGLTGRQVQRVHRLLADGRPAWPRFSLPPSRGSMTIRDVLAQPPGDARDHAIENWAASTWAACRFLRDDIAAFLSSRGITPPRGGIEETRPRAV
jgi:hypothetical protein